MDHYAVLQMQNDDGQKEPKNERHTTYCKMNEKQKNSTLLHRSVITCLSITIILQSTEYMKGTNT